MTFRRNCTCCNGAANAPCLQRWVRQDDPRVFDVATPVFCQLVTNPIADFYGPAGVPLVIDELPTGPLPLAGGPIAFGPDGDNGIGFYNVNSNAVRFTDFLDWPRQTLVNHGGDADPPQLLLDQRQLATPSLTVTFDSLAERPCELSRFVSTAFFDRYISGTVAVSDSAFDAFSYLYQAGRHEAIGGADWQVHGSATPAADLPTIDDWTFDLTPVQPIQSGIVHDTIERLEVTYVGEHPELGRRTRRGIWHKTYNSSVGGGVVKLDDFPRDAVYRLQGFGLPDGQGEFSPSDGLISATDGAPGYYYRKAFPVGLFPTQVHALSGNVEEYFGGFFTEFVTSGASRLLDQKHGVPLVDEEDLAFSTFNHRYLDGRSFFPSGFWEGTPEIWARESILDGVLIDGSQPCLGVTSSISFGQTVRSEFADGSFEIHAAPSPFGTPASINVTNTYSPLDLQFRPAGRQEKYRAPNVERFLDRVSDTAIFPPNTSQPLGMVALGARHPDCGARYVQCIDLTDTWAVFSDPVSTNFPDRVRVSDHFDTYGEALAASEEIHGPFDPNGFYGAVSYLDRHVVTFRLDMAAAFPEINFEGGDSEASSYNAFRWQWIDTRGQQDGFPTPPEPAPPSPELFEVYPFGVTPLGGTDFIGTFRGVTSEITLAGGRHAVPTFLGDLVATPDLSYPFSFSNGHNENPQPRIHQKLNLGSPSQQAPDAAIQWQSPPQSRSTLRSDGNLSIGLDLVSDDLELTQLLSHGVAVGTGNTNVFAPFTLRVFQSAYEPSQFEAKTGLAVYAYSPDSLQISSGNPVTADQPTDPEGL